MPTSPILTRIRGFNAQLDKFMQIRATNALCMDDLADLATRIIGTSLEVARASVWMLSQDKTEMICISLYEADTDTHSRGAVLLSSDYPEYFKAFLNARVIEAVDARTDPRTNEFADGYLLPLNIYSMLDAQIGSVHQVQGVLCCESCDAIRDWTADESAFAASVADGVGLAIELDRRDQLNIELSEQNSKLGTLATEAEQAREAAETANRLKSEFLANTSHELRTPLTNILASMEILDRTDLDPLQEKWLATARRAGGYLLHTVDDLLDMSQLEFGIVKIEQSTFSCSQVLDEAIDICRGVELIETISIVRDDRVNDQLTSDPMRLQQIIVNLLSNALKYGDGKPIELALLPPTLEDMQVRFEVRDDGIGIPADQHEAIFTRFQQLNGQTNRSHGGTGLGLSIVRELVKALGGTIGVISRPTGGTIFRVELPDLAARIADT